MTKLANRTLMLGAWVVGISCSGVDGAADAGNDLSGTRLVVASLIGDDGTIQASGWFDTQRNEYCSFGPASDGTTRCLPDGDVDVLTGNVGFRVWVFADSACTEPLYFTESGCMRQTYFRFTDPATTCPNGPRIFSYGADVPPTTIIYFNQGSTTSCIAIGADRIAHLGNVGVDFSADNFFHATEVSPSSFVRATRQH